MRFGTKVMVLLVVVATAPLAAAGLVSTYLSNDAVEQQTHRLQQQVADQMARHIDGWLDGVVEGLRRTAAYLPLEQIEDRDDLAAMLWVPFRQLDHVTAIALLDSSGKAMVPPVYLAADAHGVASDLKGRPRLTAEDVTAMARNVPLKLAIQHGAALGPAYRSRSGAMRLVCAVRVDRVPERAVLAAEISLHRVRQVLDTGGSERALAYLVDPEGVVMVRSRDLPDERAQLDLKRLGAAIRAHDPYSHRHAELLGALSRVNIVDGWVLLEQPLDSALGPTRRLLLYAGLWTLLCLVLAVWGGAYVARGVSRPVDRLARAAQRIQDGDYDARAGVQGDDELARLGRAFDAMADAVGQAVAQVEQQREELRQLNEELQHRVEERTREVHDALEQVIRSQKLGAVGELAAGLAHEVNNPLAGVMGLCELLRGELAADDPRRETVDEMLDQAGRIRDVLRGLQRFAERPEGVEHDLLDLRPVCRDALELSTGALEPGALEVDCELPDELPRVRGSADDLRLVVLQLVQNAVRAMDGRGRLTVTLRAVEGAVRLTVTDTGKGIPADEQARIFEPFYATDKTRTRRPGMGLAVVHRIVSEHHGQIAVRSTPGHTEFGVTLPGQREERHLE